jgi:hypothetical protein
MSGQKQDDAQQLRRSWGVDAVPELAWLLPAPVQLRPVSLTSWATVTQHCCLENTARAIAELAS